MNGDQRAEVEFKFRVRGEEDFARLRAVLGREPSERVRQVNHIFDTPDFALRKGKLSLRLREESGHCTLTLKGPTLERSRGSELDAALTARPEEECELEPGEAEAVLAGRAAAEALARRRLPRSELLERIAAAIPRGSSLVRMGSFENDRERIGPLPVALGGRTLEITYELDSTRFPGGVIEREIEVEVMDRSMLSASSAGDLESLGIFLRAQLSRAGVRWDPSTSKVARFYERIGAS
jgi:uncharacterized protein YjbK